MKRLVEYLFSLSVDQRLLKDLKIEEKYNVVALTMLNQFNMHAQSIEK